MSLILTVLMALTQTTTPAPARDLTSLINGLDRSFARMRDFSADFVQIEKDSLNQSRRSSGHLYLMRPRKMRWEYKVPEETYYISDGKVVYFYVPADRQVTKDQVRETFDDRIPLMFLVGQSNLQGEFTRFETLADKPVVEGMKVIRMYPKRKTDITELVMEVDPRNYDIRRLVLGHADGSRMEFLFSNIQTNRGLQAPLFDFKPPPGVKVLEGLGQ